MWRGAALARRKTQSDERTASDCLEIRHDADRFRLAAEHERGVNRPPFFRAARVELAQIMRRLMLHGGLDIRRFCGKCEAFGVGDADALQDSRHAINGGQADFPFRRRGRVHEEHKAPAALDGVFDFDCADGRQIDHEIGVVVDILPAPGGDVRAADDEILAVECGEGLVWRSG